MSPKKSIYTKICGLVSPEEAFLCAKAGAQFIGIIFSRHSIRQVGFSQGQEISLAAREGGAKVVAVFVEQEKEDIQEICSQCAISYAQLHGNPSRLTYLSLPTNLNTILVVERFSTHSSPHDFLEQVHRREKISPEKQSVLLFDQVKGEKADSFLWDNFSPPADAFWFLAGGLNPENVSQAICQHRPWGVDVCSGVTISDRRHKDIDKVKQFLDQVRKVSS